MERERELGKVDRRGGGRGGKGKEGRGGRMVGKKRARRVDQEVDEVMKE